MTILTGTSYPASRVTLFTLLLMLCYILQKLTLCRTIE